MDRTDTDNFYEILGLPPHASAEDIRAAYRQKARRVHPDVAGWQGTTEFVRLNRAYETLSDPHRRRAYDEQLLGVRRTVLRRTVVSSGSFRSPVTLASVLADLVAGMSDIVPPVESQRVDVHPVHVELVLVPEAARAGARVRLDVPIAVICGNCGGSGLAPPFVCPSCRGKGRWSDTRRVGFFLPPPIRDGQTVLVNLVSGDEPAGQLHVHVRLSWL